MAESASALYALECSTAIVDRTHLYRCVFVIFILVFNGGSGVAFAVCLLRIGGLHPVGEKAWCLLLVFIRRSEVVVRKVGRGLSGLDRRTAVVPVDSRQQILMLMVARLLTSSRLVSSLLSIDVLNLCATDVRLLSG